jgi:nitrous oxide reductase accessory protein NosL
MKRLLMLIPLVFLCCLGCQRGEEVTAADVEKDIQTMEGLQALLNKDLGEIQPQVSPEGGSSPRWASDERKLLYYRNNENEFIAVTFETEPTLKLGTPRKINTVPNWFEKLKEKVPVD